jgi:hypothetical protein
LYEIVGIVQHVFGKIFAQSQKFFHAMSLKTRASALSARKIERRAGRA